MSQETILKQKTLRECLIAIQEYLNSFTFDEKLKSEEEKGEYIYSKTSFLVQIKFITKEKHQTHIIILILN